MLRLASILYSIVATATAGSAVIAALSLGYETWQAIVIAAALGAVAAVPLSWFIAQQILKVKV